MGQPCSPLSNRKPGVRYQRFRILLERKLAGPRLTRFRVFREPWHSQRTYENVNRAVTSPDRGWAPLHDSGSSLAQLTESKPDDKRPEMPPLVIACVRVLIVVAACPKPARSGTA